MKSLATTSSVVKAIGLVALADSLSKTRVSLINDDPLLSAQL